MVAEFDNTDTNLDIPKHTGHITGARDDLSIVDEAATAEVTGMRTQFAGTTGVSSILAVEVID